jgi:hypothetical protein
MSAKNHVYSIHRVHMEQIIFLATKLVASLKAGVRNQVGSSQPVIFMKIEQDLVQQSKI